MSFDWPSSIHLSLSLSKQTTTTLTMSDQIKSRKVKPITKMWNAMPWKSIAFEDVNLGEFDESILFGLEELDGNAYVLDKKESGYKLEMRVGNNSKSKDTDTTSSKDKDSDNNKKKLKKLRKSKKTAADATKAPVINLIPEGSKYWGPILLHTLLYDALINLGFTRPTPIQEKAIPAALTNDCDIVGAAETGSGKTLAFVLPILNRILIDSYRQQEIDPSKMYQNRYPSAMIIAPTRELALQIAKVLKDICERFKAFRPISIVPVVGGMAEQKQRRLLGPHSRPPDVVVGTPGRLCELIQDQEIQAFRDLSRLKFLCVDEADRIVEEGHFPEVGQ
jgi:ATP-dependent RNA helicase DDX24/MAK5